MKYETSINDSSNNKRIAKNTLLLYFRMLLMMVVTLYTSRVVLATLGVEDYGIYNVVGGVVTMFGFISGCMSTATQRYLTFELGKGRVKRLQEVFNVSILIHGIVALVILVVAETIGLWFLWNKMQIPTGRLDAAFWVYQSSVLAALIMIMSIPYNATIIAHERMSAFACISVLEVLLKLGIVYLLLLLNVDKLILYAVLIVAVQFAVRICYGWYCKCHFKETRIRLTWNRCLIKEMLSFAGWSIVGNAAYVAYTQGINVLLNIFFGPTVNAARAISVQVQHAVNMFSQNFQTAINPQIIKLYAARQYDESRKLTLESSIYVFELFLLIGIPVLLLTEPIMKLWLKEVPEYAVAFSQCIIVSAMMGTYSSAFYTPLTAAGKLKGNSLAALFVCGGQFILAYMLLKCGFSVMWVQYSYIGVSFLFAFIIKPYLLVKEMGYKVSEFARCFRKSFFILVFSSTMPFVIAQYMDRGSFLGFVTIGTISVFNVLIVALVFLPKEIKTKLMMRMKVKFNQL